MLGILTMFVHPHDVSFPSPLGAKSSSRLSCFESFFPLLSHLTSMLWDLFSISGLLFHNDVRLTSCLFLYLLSGFATAQFPSSVASFFMS
jgi:hypothetical protein